MNFQFDPANVDFGQPNVPPLNPAGSVPDFLQPQHKPLIQPQQQNKSKINLSFSQKMKNILNMKTGTVFFTAIAMSIGYAFKDFVQSTVTNLFQPLIILLITTTHLNNYIDVTSLISPQNNILHISSFITALITFLLIIITITYLSNIIIDL